MSKEPGRNEPCPCGSGQKWKKCCRGLPLPDQPLATTEGRLLERFAHLVAAVQGEALERFGAPTLARWSSALQGSDPTAELAIFAEFTALHVASDEGDSLAEIFARHHLLSKESRSLLEAVAGEPYSVYRLSRADGQGTVELHDAITGVRRQVRSDGRLEGRVGEAWLYAKVLSHGGETVLLSCWPLLVEQAPAEAVVRRYLKGRQRVKPATLLKPEEAQSLYLSWSVMARAVAALRNG
jgi:hypothetical protein